MISDVLCDAVDEINRYINDDTFSQVYAGKLRKDIISLRDNMDTMRIRLDTPPTPKIKNASMEAKENENR